MHQPGHFSFLYLLQGYGFSSGQSGNWDNSAIASSRSNRKNLSLYLEGFGVVLEIMQTKEALSRIASENLEDLAEHNVAYAEIRFAPELCLNKTASFNCLALNGLHSIIFKK